MRERRSGIYAIETATGAYIGATMDTYTRYYAHAAKLRTGKHPSRQLQEAFDAEGGATWRVLEYCEEHQLDRRERRWMAMYGDKVLNAAPHVGYGGGMRPERRALVNKAHGLTNLPPSDTVGETRRLMATLTLAKPASEIEPAK